MPEPDNGRKAWRDGSLLSLGETLRASRPVERQSKLADALAKVRSETAESRTESMQEPAASPRIAAAPARPEAETAFDKTRGWLRDFIARQQMTDPVQVRVEEPVTEVAEPARSRSETEDRDEPSPPPAAQTFSAAGTVTETREDAEERYTPVASTSPFGWRPLIDPSKVVSGVFRSKKLIAATTILGALLGVMVALNTPKTYEAGAEMLADPRDLNLVDKELTQSGISNEATLAIVDNQVRILTSGGVLNKVVDRLNLADDPEFNGQGSGEGLKGLIGKVRSVFFTADSDAEAGRRHALATMALSEALSVERSGKTFIIVVRATTRSPEKSALIANTMTEVFLQSSGDIQSDAAGRAAGELTGRLDELRKGVEAAERKVEAFRSENDLVDAQGRLITDDEILKLNEQLSIARARTLELNARATSTRSVNVDSVLSGAIPEELASASMQELRSQYSTLKGEADRVAVRLGPKHPSLMAMQAQLVVARDLINTEIRRIVSSSQTELKRAVQLEQELSSRLAQLKVRQGSLSNELVSLRELEREVTAKRAVYESFLLRARETGEQQGINSANISVISKAYPPLEASGSSRSTIAIVGTVLGFLAGVGMGGARGTFDSLRTTAGGDLPPRPFRRVRKRRATATMFDSPDAPEGEPPTAPISFYQSEATPSPADPPAADPIADPRDSEPADASAEPKDETMHQYQPDPWASEQQRMTAAPQNHAPHAYAPTPASASYAPVYAVHGEQQPMPQAYAPQPYGYPQPLPGQIVYVQAMPPQTDIYSQPLPMQPQAYAQPMPQYWQQPHFQGMAPGQPHAAPMVQPAMYAQPQAQRAQPVQPAPLQPSRAQAEPATPIEEIRASLRECREAIRELAEARTPKRYF